MTTLLPLEHAETDADVAACFELMQQLRPHLSTPDELVARVADQRAQQYRLLAMWDGRRPVALAGYRQVENLIHGRFLYVDDLVTDERERGRSHGERMIDALREIGRCHRCGKLVLDTALSNVLAQRFYFRAGMLPRALRFSEDLQ